jgi:hypothetical protein
MVPQVPVRRRAAAARTGLALVLAGLLLAMGPFAVALGVHHALAAADHDGHEHSDTDLCQWVQAHSFASLLAPIVDPGRFFSPERHDPSLPAVRFSAQLLSYRPSRAPPST